MCDIYGLRDSRVTAEISAAFEDPMIRVARKMEKRNYCMKTFVVHRHIAEMPFSFF